MCLYHNYKAQQQPETHMADAEPAENISVAIHDQTDVP